MSSYIRSIWTEWATLIKNAWHEYSEPRYISGVIWALLARWSLVVLISHFLKVRRPEIQTIVFLFLLSNVLNIWNEFGISLKNLQTILMRLHFDSILSAIRYFMYCLKKTAYFNRWKIYPDCYNQVNDLMGMQLGGGVIRERPPNGDIDLYGRISSYRTSYNADRIEFSSGCRSSFMAFPKRNACALPLISFLSFNKETEKNKIKRGKRLRYNVPASFEAGRLRCDTRNAIIYFIKATNDLQSGLSYFPFFFI